MVNDVVGDDSSENVDDRDDWGLMWWFPSAPNPKMHKKYAEP